MGREQEISGLSQTPTAQQTCLRLPERVIYGQGKLMVTIRGKFITSSSLTVKIQQCYFTYKALHFLYLNFE